MKTLEVIEPLTSAESTEYESSKFEIASTQKHVERWVKAVIRIRDGRLYRCEFSTFAEFCEKNLNKTARAVHLACEAEEVRANLKVKRASLLSDKAAISLGEIEPEFQKQVLKEAEKSPEGATAKSIKRAAKKLLPAPEPEQPRAFGAFSGRPVDTSAYTSAPATEPPLGAAFGGDEPETDDEALTPVTDALTAIKRLEQTYEAHKEWMNAVPPRMPRQILDRLIEGMRL